MCIFSQCRLQDHFLSGPFQRLENILRNGQSIEKCATTDCSLRRLENEDNHWGHGQGFFLSTFIPYHNYCKASGVIVDRQGN